MLKINFRLRAKFSRVFRNGFLSTNCTNFTNEFYADEADLSKFHKFFVRVLFSVFAEELGGLTADASALGSSGEKFYDSASAKLSLISLASERE